MADSNNIPQEANQLSEDLNSGDKGTQKTAKKEVAKTDFDKEYDIAMQNENGSGTQSSDPNPVNREKGEAAAGDSSFSTTGSAAHSPGDSDPSDYMDMAKEVTKNVPQ